VEGAILAGLAKDPKGWELEDFVAAHFISRGCYVETGVTERNPDEILELDLFWTDYQKEPPEQHPVEVKSGDWGLADIFKFYGWTRYLSLNPGEFICKEPCGRINPNTIKHIQERTGISLLQVSKPEDTESHFKALLEREPAWEKLPGLWRYSFWAQRRLLQSLGEAIRNKTCPTSAKAAKDYHQLINDAVFFIPDITQRINDLLSAHFDHKELGKSAAFEIETGNNNFEDPPDTKTFKAAIYQGQWFPVQACLYLAHRARLYILKTIVDYWLAREQGKLKKAIIKIGQTSINLTNASLTPAMQSSINELSSSKSFRLFPVFWQVFLWGWGGFLLKDRLDEEYACLEKETGIPRNEIDIALSAFEKLFPVKGGWFREPRNDSRKLLILMPAAMRGLGAFRRRVLIDVENYSDLGYHDSTTARLSLDHNAGAQLLDCNKTGLVK
jgi:hypothetical protein